MYIESIQITSFASLVGRSFDLHRGLNLLEGANEAGKSSVAEFIRYVLYGFASKSDRERYLGFESEGVSGSLILCDGEKRYRVERKTVGSKEQAAIYDLDSGTQVFVGRVPGEVFFGIPSSLFVGTVFVGQAGGSRIQGKSTAEAVDNLLFAADEGINVKKALKRLDDTRVSLLYKNKKGGRLYETEGALSAVNLRYTKAKEDGTQIRQLETKIREIDVAYEEERLRVLTEELNDYYLLKTRERKAQLRELEEAYLSATEAYEAHRKQYTRGGFFPDTRYFESLKDGAGELKRCQDRIAVLEKRLDVLNREIEKHDAETEIRLREEEKRRASLTGKRSASLALAVLSLILFLLCGAGAAFFFLTAKGTLGAIAVAVTLLALGGMIGGFTLGTRYATALHALDGEADAKDDDFRGRLAVVRDDLSDEREARRRCKERLDELCGRWEMSYSQAAVTEMVSVIEEEKRLSDAQEKARMLYIQQKANQEGERAHEPEDDGREICLPEKFDVRDAEGRRKLAERSIQYKRQALHEAELELTRLRATSEDPSTVLEEALALSEERDRLQRRYDATVLAAEKLTVAAETMRASVSPRLSKAAGERMSAVTSGRYEELGVDAEMQMTFRPLTRDGGRVTKEETFMSAGTSDAAYVSLRLSLRDLICPDKQPPLIFDESFARLDDTRLTSLLSLLHEDGAQILLLTSSDRERRLLDAAGMAHHRLAL